MIWSVILVNLILLSTCHPQQLFDNRIFDLRVNSNSLDTRLGKNVAEVPNLIASGVNTVKQLPYVEVLRLIESFVRLKGEISGKIWGLIYDNKHIWTAVRDTIINKIATIHNLTLTFIIASSGGFFG